MAGVKKYIKYVIWVILGYAFSSFLIFVGLNANYKSIELRGELPNQVIVKKAEATKEQGRIYGLVKNKKDVNLNNKYLKISIFNSSNEEINTNYLKIEGLKNEEEKMFKNTFSSKGAKYYEIKIVENN